MYDIAIMSSINCMFQISLVALHTDLAMLISQTSTSHTAQGVLDGWVGVALLPDGAFPLSSHVSCSVQHARWKCGKLHFFI